uniref:Triple gene block 1 protein n=1 Tax=Shallot latent virus TaxID=12172 RepID=A0A6M2VIJ0_9VIRU|nr:triple gene block 1 protein [Shallot latent virus]QCY49514.1 triple gene block 1 protein [Shallot latent virus]
MDVFCKVLIECGFSRLEGSGNKCKVVLGVPGCGKSSCIRRLINLDSRFIAATFGFPDPLNVTGRRIRAVSELAVLDCAGKFLLLDEFQQGDFEDLKPFALFGDVCQFFDSTRAYPVADWCKTVSHRVNKLTCDYLQGFGFEITSSERGELFFGGLYEKELQGTVITYCTQVSSLLEAHRVEHYTLENCRGSEFSEVSLCLSDSVIHREDLAKFYVCATRSRGNLLILTPDASKPTA